MHLVAVCVRANARVCVHFLACVNAQVVDEQKQVISRCTVLLESKVSRAPCNSKKRFVRA